MEAKRAAAELSEELYMVQQENHSAMVANGKLQRSVSSSKKRSKLLEQSLQELSAITLRQKSKLKTMKAARNALLSLVDERSCDNERLSTQLGQLQSQTTETIELLRHTGEEQATRVGELETLLRVKEKMLDDQGLLLSELKSRINALEDQKRRNVDDVREMESLLEEQKQDIFLLEEQLQHKDTIENKLNVVVSELQARLSFLESSLLVSTAGPENQSNSGSDQMACGETKLSVDAADEMSRLKDEAAAIKSELEAKQTAVDDLTLQLALAVDAAAQKGSDEQLLLRSQIVSLCAVLFIIIEQKLFLYYYYYVYLSILTWVISLFFCQADCHTELARIRTLYDEGKVCI
jgi:chromosome segregation ATPase